MTAITSRPPAAGSKAIPTTLTQDGLPRGRWNEPFNDTYINYSRDGLPIHNRRSDIAGRIANITSAILREDGKKIEKDGQIIYVFPDGKIEVI